MYFLNLDSDTDYKFDMSRFMQYTTQYDPFWSYLINNIKKIPYTGQYRIDQEEGRAELLSYNLYQTTKLWWFLLLYNDKICPFDLKRGEYIYYPTLNAIDNFYMDLRSLQSTNNNKKYF